MRKLADIVTSLWLGIIVLHKELFNVTPVFWIYYITSIWNKWKCERENQSLDSYLPEDYYDLNYNGRTKLSIFLIHYIGAQSDLTQVTTLNKKLTAQPPRLIGHKEIVNYSELWKVTDSFEEQCM